jgi:hypothetical protein
MVYEGTGAVANLNEVYSQKKKIRQVIKTVFLKQNFHTRGKYTATRTVLVSLVPRT